MAAAAAAATRLLNPAVLGQTATFLATQRIPALSVAAGAAFIAAAGKERPLLFGRFARRGLGAFISYISLFFLVALTVLAASVACYTYCDNTSDQFKGVLRSLLVSVGQLALAFWAASWIGGALPVSLGSWKPTGKPQEGYDCIIVGAGTVGASMSTLLARQGRRVLCLDRTFEPTRRIVGELMQPGGMRCLERMGMIDCARKGIDSVPVYGYVIIRPDGTELPLAYPMDEAHGTLAEFGVGQSCSNHTADSRNPKAPSGSSFHNYRFVDELRAVTRKERNVDLTLGTFNELIVEGEGSNAKVVGIKWTDGTTKQQRETRAPLVVLADGIFSATRKTCSSVPKGTVVSHFCGVIMEHEPFKTPLPRPYHGHVILAQPHPVLMYQISPTETRVLVDVATPMPPPEELQKYFLNTVLPQLPECVQQPFRHAVTTQTPQCMPNTALPAGDMTMKGCVMLGDAWNIRHPLTGGGMTVALLDVELLVKLLRNVDFANTAAVTAAHEIFLTKRKNYAATINVLANALHRVFTAPAHDDGTRADLRYACFDYLHAGGTWSAGPLGLLSGLTQRPWVLATHFFLVAIHAQRLALLPFPTPSRLRRSYNLIRVACIIIMPLLEIEDATWLASWPIRFASNLFFPWRSSSL